MELKSNWSIMSEELGNFTRALCMAFIGLMLIPVAIIYFSEIYNLLGIPISLIILIFSWICLIYLWIFLFRIHKKKLSKEYRIMIDESEDEVKKILKK